MARGVIENLITRRLYFVCGNCEFRMRWTTNSCFYAFAGNIATGRPDMPIIKVVQSATMTVIIEAKDSRNEYGPDDKKQRTAECWYNRR